MIVFFFLKKILDEIYYLRFVSYDFSIRLGFLNPNRQYHAQKPY